jgi:hypothetical protein
MSSPLRRPDADGEDLHPALRGCLEHVVERALVILAVGDEDERLMPALVALERRQARFEGRRQVGAAARNEPDLDGLQALAERVPVEREGTLHERRAGERDEPDTVARHLREQVLDGELRAL